MQNVSNQIKEIIKKKRKGSVFFTDEFRQSGSNDAIRQTLSRLCKEGFIIRLSAGIYLYPKRDRYIGTLYPSIETIARAIAKQEKARIIPTGVYALNALGLSTQVPMRVVFLTDGTPRMINIEGKASIRFQKTIPKYLSFKGKITSLVIFALKEIGKDKLTNAHIEKIRKLLHLETRKNILHDAQLAPAWISGIILKLVENE
jgi:hypothetical protein